MPMPPQTPQSSGPPPQRTPFVWSIYDARTRGVLLQVLLVLGLMLLFYEMVTNAAENLRRQNVASGFDFLGRTSGFDISQKLISYANTMSFGRAFWVGLLNTILVAVFGIALATVLGLLIGIARLSSNWLIARLATAYVEIIRNVPLLLQLLFWYFAALRSLPMPQQSYDLPGSVYLNRRGLYLPWPSENWIAGVFLLAVAAGLLAAWLWRRHADRRAMQTGVAGAYASYKAIGIALAPALAWLVLGPAWNLVYPEPGRFNIESGLNIQPEFGALLIGLAVYTAAFIAEIVRAGIQGVPRGQTEAAQALGLSRAETLKRVVLPQALRIIIPPLTNQYLNLTKNSSLAVAIGYPDLVSVFSGTVLNLTNQAVEVILITMAVYLTLSLATSALMNWFNARWALVER
jgi:general L-amino acid transport system permease protein